MEEDKIKNLIELFKAMETHQEIMIGNPKAYRETIEHLIARNKELEEYQHKVNEIMCFDEENLDTVRVNNNYTGLKNCITQFRKQVKELEQLLEEKTIRLGFENQENYIPKSKVREKIEELRNEEYDDITFKYNRIEVNGIIEIVLEELLED